MAKPKTPATTIWAQKEVVRAASEVSTTLGSELSSMAGTKSTQAFRLLYRVRVLKQINSGFFLHFPIKNIPCDK